MLRVVLALILAAVVGGVGFYIGRSSAKQAFTPVHMPPPQPKDQARARVKLPAFPSPPSVTPQTDLSSPNLPHAETGQVPGDPAPLFERALSLPIIGLKASAIQNTFDQARGGGERVHEATDILAPRGTPVVAVDTGIIAKLFDSKPGGLTVYQFDPSQKYAYYYAHLDRYAEGLKEGLLVKKGDVVGYVGSTGNADPKTPHLHFAIFELGPEKHWWQGKPINPYPLLMRAVAR